MHARLGPHTHGAKVARVPLWYSEIRTDLKQKGEDYILARVFSSLKLNSLV